MTEVAAASAAGNDAAQRTVEYVGFWKRLIASIIDTLVVMLVIVPLLFAVYGPGYFRRGPEAGLAGFWDYVIQLVLPAVAVIVFWKFRGATPGKMAVSAKIVDARTLGEPSNARLVVRYFAYIVSAIPLFLGFLWIAFDRRKQGWHDKIAGTVVIHDDN